MTASPDNLDTIRATLSEQAEEVARALLGPENRRASSRRELRWGNHGSLSLALRGRKRGFWFDHSALAGGDLLALVRREIGCDFPEALAWARRFLGWPVDGPVPEHVPRVVTPTLDAAAEAEELARIAKARQIWESCGAVENTLAETYLARRGIIRPACGWPADVLGYHARRKALALAVRDDEGDVVAVQLVHLDAEGQKAEATKTRPTKQSFGPIAGRAVRLPGIEDGPVVIAEGPETALSIWSATGLATWAALGSTASLALPDDVPVIVARDDDKKWSPSDRRTRDAVRQWQEEGRQVAVAWPWETRRGDKTDFNDVLMTSGRASVRTRIDEARRFLDAPTPPRSPRRLTLTAARERLDAEVGSFFAAAIAGEDLPPRALRVDLGTGKTETALRHAGRTLSEMRAAGDERAIVIAVPEHRLGLEIIRRFERMAHDLRAAAWRGREALDPEALDGAKMCRNGEKVREASALLLDVEKTVCATCPFAATCSYLGQKHQAADLWVVGHRLLFTTKPGAIPDVAAVVVDESPWTAALVGTEGRPVALPLDALTDPSIPVPEDDGVASNGARLSALRTDLYEALSEAPDGPVNRLDLDRVGLSEASGNEGRGLEWMRKRTDGDLEPNRNLTRFAMAWDAVAALMARGGPQASGWMELARDGEGARILMLRGRRNVSSGFKAPTMFLDASLDVDLLRPIWPDVTAGDAVQVEAPHVRLRQCTDRAFSKTMLEPLSDEAAEAKPAEAKRRTKNLRELHARLYQDATTAGGPVLIVSNKSITDALRPLRWPEGVELAHFNSVAGRDQWRDVARLIVIGRPMPRPRDVERMAEALTGSAGERVAGFFPSGDAARILRDGSTVQAETVTHPDATARRIIDRIVTGEIQQAIGRGRGVNRTAADPLDVLAYGDAVLDGVDILSTFERPSPVELMLAAGGVAFENPTHAATAYPDLWPSRDAAKKAMARRLGTFPNKDTLIGDCPQPLAAIRYQRAGPGQSPAFAHIEATLDPREALATLLGPITLQVTADDAEARPALDALQDVPGDAVPVITPDIPPPLAAQPLASSEPDKPERLDVPPVIIADAVPVILMTEPPANDDDDDLDPVERFRLRGGIIPPAMIPAARRLQRESGFKQSELAARVGISRPQLANALQSRFGLSPEPAARLVALIERPPKVIAPLLF